jgi:hypothetical protein
MVGVGGRPHLQNGLLGVLIMKINNMVRASSCLCLLIAIAISLCLCLLIAIAISLLC